MAKSMPGSATLIYRIYFLYLEPVFALLGAYLCVFQPGKFLESTTPAGSYTYADPVLPSPLIRLLLINIASLYILFAIVEGIVLRMSKDVAVWRTILATIAMVDIGHIYAIYAIAPDTIADFGTWTSNEWINNGILALGLALRIGFLLS